MMALRISGVLGVSGAGAAVGTASEQFSLIPCGPDIAAASCALDIVQHTFKNKD